MANILFVESDPIAVKAFTGLMNRSAHEFRTVSSIEVAWDALAEDKFYDLVVLEVRLDGSNGKALISDIRNHPFYAKQPILVYSKMSDKRSIRSILILDIQNFLLKPYDDEKLYAEINKAHKMRWWTEYFDSEIHTCSRLGMTAEELIKRYRSIVVQLKQFPDKTIEIEDRHQVSALKLQKLLDGAGIPILQTLVSNMAKDIKENNIPRLERELNCLPQAIRLLGERIKPGRFIHADEDLDAKDSEEEPNKKSFKSVEKVCNWEEMQKKILEMEGYPVVDSVAASFQMAALNADIEIQTLVRMIETDPCLATQVIYHCNLLPTKSSGQEVAITDPKQAIQMFGLTRMRSVASSVVTIPGESLNFRGFGWEQYWTYQMGCAMLSEEIVNILSLPLNSGLAFFGGMVHEMGKIIFAYHFPDAFEHAMQVANSTAVPLTDTEKHYFGCTHEQVGKFFAEHGKFPAAVAACCGHYRDPTKALPQHQEIVAVVSLADYLCKLFEIGFSGSRIPKDIVSFAAHPSWQILKPILYHGFTVAKFERACKERVGVLKKELQGLTSKKH